MPRFPFLERNLPFVKYTLRGLQLQKYFHTFSKCTYRNIQGIRISNSAGILLISILFRTLQISFELCNEVIRLWQSSRCEQKIDRTSTMCGMRYILNISKMKETTKKFYFSLYVYSYFYYFKRSNDSNSCQSQLWFFLR